MSIFNFFKKPKVEPIIPKNEPDFRELESLILKHKAAAIQYENRKIGNLESWGRIREAYNDVFSINLQSISMYMQYFCDTQQKKDALEERIYLNNTFAAYSSWIVGREWGFRYPDLVARFRDKTVIIAGEVPADAMEMLNKSLYDSYSLFSQIFGFYYDSEIGRPVRFQKENHLKDTYQSMLRGSLICFLSGVKSVEL